MNKNRVENPAWDKSIEAAFTADDIAGFHAQLPGYIPSPVVRLPHLVKALRVGGIIVKDEAHRFDLQAFKVMGASYAIYRFLKDEWRRYETVPFDFNNFIAINPWPQRYTLCTATDGNHGRAVAWTAKRLFQKAVIYMPKGTVPARIENIRNEGARVDIIDGSYDDTVRAIAADAEKNGWIVIADTAYPGYMIVPAYIMAGYTAMFAEMESEIHGERDPGVDIVIFQGGVGSFAAAGVWYYCNRYGIKRPRLVCVEPVEAACLLESAERGEVTTSQGSFTTIMAGLNCGTPSLLAWPIIKDGIDLFVAISDKWTEEAMRRYYFPVGNDTRIISGESGAAGLGTLMALMTSDNLKEAREWLDLGPQSRILLFNTEGATDPAGFDRVVGPSR